MFSRLQSIPADPILSLMAAFQQDSHPLKIDLGVGVYKDELSRTPVLECVKKAESQRTLHEDTKTYIGMAGDLNFNQHIERLAFGYQHPALLQNRLATAHTPGGTGALRVAAEFIRRANPDATVWVSKPTWANHMALLTAAGLNVKEFTYYDYETKALQEDAMFAELAKVPEGDVVLMHACCHNPSGMDLTLSQWQRFAQLAKENGFLPLLDMAYQGYGEGLDEDAGGLRIVAEQVDELIVCTSCSKNFGLYRERIGAVTLMSSTAQECEVSRSVLLNVVRAMYSMPPAHGAIIVSLILDSQELTQLWQQELALMRNRINQYRQILVEKLHAAGVSQDFSFIQNQHGMFSFLGISAEQVQRLRDEHSIYMVNSSRMNIAGLNQANIDYFVQAVVSVLNR